MVPELLIATEFDFSLLRGTRPVASGQWDDVQRADVQREGTVITLQLLLRGGRSFTAHDDAPGWDDLLAHAESALPGFPRARELIADLDTAAGPVTVFSR